MLFAVWRAHRRRQPSPSLAQRPRVRFEGNKGAVAAGGGFRDRRRDCRVRRDCQRNRRCHGGDLPLHRTGVPVRPAPKCVHYLSTDFRVELGYHNRHTNARNSVPPLQRWFGCWRRVRWSCLWCSSSHGTGVLFFKIDISSYERLCPGFALRPAVLESICHPHHSCRTINDIGFQLTSFTGWMGGRDSFLGLRINTCSGA